MSTSHNVSVDSPHASPPWISLYREVCEQCDATRNSVLETQKRVRDEVVPRLERVCLVSENCDVTLRGILRALRRSVGDSSSVSATHAPAAADSSLDGDQNSTSLNGRVREQELEGHAPNATSAADTARRVEQLEERLEAFTRQVEGQHNAAVREGQRQQRELQQLRHGVEQMEQCKGQLLVVLRQLQLDKVALLRACAADEPASNGARASGSPLLMSSWSRGGNQSGTDAHRVNASEAELADLESTVSVLERRMRQEHAVREAQVRDLAATLQQLEDVHAAHYGDHRLSARFRPTSPAVPHASSNYLCDPAPTRARGADDHDDGAGEGSPNRKLRNPFGSVSTPCGTPAQHTGRRTERTAGLSDAHRVDGREGLHKHQAVVLRDRLLRFYALYDPRMIPAVAEVVREFKGPEEELLATLEMDYSAHGYFSRD